MKIDRSIAVHILISGPKLPLDNLYGSTMVTSPTGKGVVVIGGITNSPTMTKKRFVGNANYSLSATATMLEPLPCRLDNTIILTRGRISPDMR